jgi:hypothetical protein
VQQLQLRNVSVRRLRVAFATQILRAGAASVDVTVHPAKFFIGPGRSINVRLRARVTSAFDGNAPAEGIVIVKPQSGAEIHVPWAISFGPRIAAALSRVHLASRSFRPSDTRPTLLDVVAGGVPRTALGQDVRPLARLDLELWSPEGGRIGVLATMRDVLPGRYAFGVTGRDPTGQVLPSGPYTLRLIAYPVDKGSPTIRTVPFTIK